MKDLSTAEANLKTLPGLTGAPERLTGDGLVEVLDEAQMKSPES